MGHFLEEYGDETSIDNEVNDFISNMESERPDEDEDLDEQMDDVELRLEVAACYRQLLRNSLFTESTPGGKVVDKRVRAFIKADMKRLLGLYTAQPKVTVDPLFSEEEVALLKRMILSIKSKALRSDVDVGTEKPVPTVAQAKPPTPPPINQIKTATKQAVRQTKPAPSSQKDSDPTKKTAVKKAPPALKDGILSEEKTEKPGEKVVTKRVNGHLVREFYKNDQLVNVQNRTEVRSSPKKKPMPTQEQQVVLSEQQANRDVSASMRRGIS